MLTRSFLPTVPSPVYKPGKVAVVLAGRQAGKKVVVIKQYDDGTKERPYPHAIVAGIERYPLKVNKSMGAKRIARRSKVKPFIKAINYTHLYVAPAASSVNTPLGLPTHPPCAPSVRMPTRYALDLEALKGSVTVETLKEPCVPPVAALMRRPTTSADPPHLFPFPLAVRSARTPRRPSRPRSRSATRPARTAGSSSRSASKHGVRLFLSPPRHCGREMVMTSGRRTTCSRDGDWLGQAENERGARVGTARGGGEGDRLGDWKLALFR